MFESQLRAAWPLAGSTTARVWCRFDMVWSACNQLLGKILCTSAGNDPDDRQIPLVPMFATSQWREINLRVRDRLSFLLSPKWSTKYWSFGLFDPWSMLSSVHEQCDVPSLLFSPQEWKEWSRDFSEHFNVIRPPFFCKNYPSPSRSFCEREDAVNQVQLSWKAAGENWSENNFGSHQKPSVHSPRATSLFKCSPSKFVNGAKKYRACDGCKKCQKFIFLTCIFTPHQEDACNRRISCSILYTVRCLMLFYFLLFPCLIDDTFFFFRNVKSHAVAWVNNHHAPKCVLQFIRHTLTSN